MRRVSSTFINLIMASDLSQRMRSALDFGAAIALLMILTALALNSFESYIAQSQLSEAFGLSSTIRVDLIAYRAEHGGWPATNREIGNADVAEKFYVGEYVDHFELGRDGALTAVFSDDSSVEQLRNRRLTLRPLTLAQEPGAPVAWVCGPHQYPAEMVPGGIDETDISPTELPSICRNY